MNRIEQFLELINNVDMNSLGIVDQMTIALAFAEMMEKVEPILLKNNLSNPNVSNFIFKL